jgi:hypothetical protein
MRALHVCLVTIECNRSNLLPVLGVVQLDNLLQFLVLINDPHCGACSATLAYIFASPQRILLAEHATVCSQFKRQPVPELDFLWWLWSRLGFPALGKLLGKLENCHCVGVGQARRLVQFTLGSLKRLACRDRFLLRILRLNSELRILFCVHCWKRQRL